MAENCAWHKTLNNDTGLCEWRWLTILTLWIIFNVGPMWYTIWANKRSRVDPVRDKKYMALARIDYDNWSYFTAIFTHFFFLPRFILGWSSFFLTAIFATCMSLGHDPYKLPEGRARVVRLACDWCAMFGCWCASIFPKRVRVEADYTKWLGPGYEKTYDGAGFHVTNHLTAWDAAICWAY